MGRNPKGLAVGARAILFIRPEALRPEAGAAEATLTSDVVSVAFEGNLTHLYLRGEGRKEISLSIGRGAGDLLPSQGASTPASYAPEAGLVLPEGALASE